MFNVTRNNLYIFLHWPHRLLDRKQVDDEESVEDDEDDEFLKGFKVLRSSFITGIMFEEVLRFYMLLTFFAVYIA